MTLHAPLLLVDSLQGMARAPAFAEDSMLSRDGIFIQPREILNRLLRWESDFVAGNAPATVKAVRADWNQYLSWCDSARRPALPCDVGQLVEFLSRSIQHGKKRATINRYVYTVGLIHDAAGLHNPIRHSQWKQKFRVLVRELAAKGGNAQSQAKGLTADGVNQILSGLGDSLMDLRDAAMLCIASDTLCRESEIVAIRTDDLVESEGGKMQLHVPFSKTDQEGVGEDYRYLSDETISRLMRWIDAAGIEGGYIFRATAGRPKANGDTGAPLLPQEVGRIFKRRAKAAGLKDAFRVSGHSTRVGSAVDLGVAGTSMAQIMDAGGWKTERMVMRYLRRSNIGDKAMSNLRTKIPLASQEKD